MSSGEVSSGSSSPKKTFTLEDIDRDDSSTRLSSLETSNSGQEEQPSNFCLRDYVFRNRRRNLSTNWPFSQKFLKLCFSHGVGNLLPPFKSLETLESRCSRPPSPPANSPKPKIIPSEIKKPRVSSVCPVCLNFNSPSNTAMNAHIDQCLSPELIQVKRRAKQKMKSMAEICATAPEWTLEDLDRRNGSNWAAELSYETKVNGWDEKREKDGPIYVDSRGIKVLILSRLNGSFVSSSKVKSSIKQTTNVIPEKVNGFAFDESKVRRRKRSALTFRSISSLAKALTLTTPESTDQMDRSQSPTKVKTGVDKPCKSSPVSSVSTISHISAEERETSSSSPFLERERSPHARHLSLTSNILSHRQFKRHRSPASRPTLRLMGKNLTVINPSHQSILGFPFSEQREETPKRRTTDNLHYSYDGEKLNTNGSPYHWLPSWGGSQKAYHGDSRVSAGLLPSVSWVPP